MHKYIEMPRKKKKKKLNWQQLVVIILLLLLAFLLIFSRGQRAARRVSFPLSEQAGEMRDHYQQTAMNNNHIPSIHVTRDMILGHIDPAGDLLFSAVDPAYASRAGMFMRSEAYEAFLAMRDAAARDGVTLTILSATRPFDHQKRIWENKWHGRQVLHGNIMATDIPDPVERAREILRFSAMPGTSRHHWGTDIDLNSLQNSYFESGEGKAVYLWLQEHAGRFGFCQPYTAHGDRRDGGYEEEKWHWSYRPVSKQFLAAFEEKISYEDIRGFDGAETAEGLRVIERYVLDISGDCR
ncbi:MAG: D-alanyl-D-alanine carboxypeptidase family protein [Bacteroidia bacterium]|nr:MAG: D-alanyl-D-alanine carboxypeptidase family protein [Bacteroidia bacterium]